MFKTLSEVSRELKYEGCTVVTVSTIDEKGKSLDIVVVDGITTKLEKKYLKGYKKLSKEATLSIIKQYFPKNIDASEATAYCRNL